MTVTDMILAGLVGGFGVPIIWTAIAVRKMTSPASVDLVLEHDEAVDLHRRLSDYLASVDGEPNDHFPDQQIGHYL